MYLYRNWDGSVYISEYLDGSEGLLLRISGKTTIGDLIDHLDIQQAIAVFRAYVLGQETEIEVFI
jgi:hypothetical protein